MRSLIPLFCLLLCNTVWCIEETAPATVPETVKNAVLEEIYKIGLVKLQPATLLFHSAPDMDDVYETIIGAYVFQITPDASTLLRGDLFYTNAGLLLDEAQRAQVRRETLALLAEEDMILYPAHDITRYCLTVFIDLDCEYCAKLRHDVPRLTAAGVRVRFLAFPQAGLNSQTFRDTVSIWCAPNRAAALARQEAKEPIEPRQCDNPVAAHFHLAEAFQVEGTPTLVFADGAMQAGYPGFKRLMQLLEQHLLTQ